MRANVDELELERAMLAVAGVSGHRPSRASGLPATPRRTDWGGEDREMTGATTWSFAGRRRTSDAAAAVIHTGARLELHEVGAAAVRLTRAYNPFRQG